jgi:hypothetical protein
VHRDSCHHLILCLLRRGNSGTNCPTSVLWFEYHSNIMLSLASSVFDACHHSITHVDIRITLAEVWRQWGLWLNQGPSSATAFQPPRSPQNSTIRQHCGHITFSSSRLLHPSFCLLISFILQPRGIDLFLGSVIWSSSSRVSSLLILLLRSYPRHVLQGFPPRHPGAPASRSCRTGMFALGCRVPIVPQ